MASVKLATLVIRTLAKPIANSLKNQAQQHETFRNLCIGLAQWSHRTEVKLRTGLLGESPKSIRPLNDTRAIQNGANSLAEGFLFAVAAGLIIGETWRGARKDSNRRDLVDESLGQLEEKIDSVNSRIDKVFDSLEARWEEDRLRNQEVTRILSRIVEIGLRGGWAELDEPVKLPATSLLLESPERSEPSLSSPQIKPEVNSQDTSSPESQA